MLKVMRISGSESLSVAANVFVGQTEAPLVVRPYISRMTESELFTMMVGGMATIAGGVLVVSVASTISDQVQMAHWMALALLCGLLVFLWFYCISTKRGFVTADSIYLDSKELGREAIVPQIPWLGLPQWVALTCASLLLTTDALVSELPDAVQEGVRRGKIVAHGAAKYLVPLARANKSTCELIASAVASARLSSRELGLLYKGWRDGTAKTRERLRTEPHVLLRALKELERASETRERSPGEKLLCELELLGTGESN